MIKVYKEQDGHWIAWNKVTGKCVDIIQFQDWFMGRVKIRYRVDVSGRTVDSLIDHFQTAKSIAIKYAKGEI